jgi:hypothetical protein
MTLESYFKYQAVAKNLNDISTKNIDDILLLIQNSNYSLEDLWKLMKKLGKNATTEKGKFKEPIWKVEDFEKRVKLTKTDIELIQFIAEKLK